MKLDWFDNSDLDGPRCFAAACRVWEEGFYYRITRAPSGNWTLAESDAELLAQDTPAAFGTLRRAKAEAERLEGCARDEALRMQHL